MDRFALYQVDQVVYLAEVQLCPLKTATTPRTSEAKEAGALRCGGGLAPSVNGQRGDVRAPQVLGHVDRSIYAELYGV